MKKYFKREYLIEELGLPDSLCNEYFIEDTIDGVDCGIVDHTLIFRDVDGKTYRTSYDVPDEPWGGWEPWECEEEVECQEVVPVKSIKWVDADKQHK